MKKIFTIIALTVLFNTNAQIDDNSSDVSATGSFSVAMGQNTEASGSRSTAMGQSTEATGYASTAMGVGTTASGVVSTAMGVSTTASGSRSTAMGYETTASGSRSTAMGRITIASGTYSTAMGAVTIASGNSSTAMGGGTEASASYSTAMGRNSKASDYGSLVIGQYNSSGSSATSADSFSTANTAFVIGNGVDSSNISDAFSILFDGTTNIAGSVTADSFIKDGGVSTEFLKADGSVDSSVYITAADIPEGIWSLDSNNTGIYSPGNTATGDYATAMGDETTASGGSSTAMGVGTTASGLSSTAMGVNTIASDMASTVIGHFNLLGSTPTSDTNYIELSPAFVIGNGIFDTNGNINRSDAFSVLFDGTTNIAGSVTADSFIKDGGVSTEFLKADGSVDSSVYITAAEVTPQADSDWDSTVSPTQILNKPTTISTQQADEITANTLKRSYPVLDEDKLATIETGAQVNVQSDWDATTGDALILNKPVIPTIVPQADSDWDSTVSPTQILNKPTTISTQQADEITANTLKRSYPVLDEDKLATIETGAQVNVQSDWDATTGDALILNKPVITDDQQLGNFILSAGSLLSLSIERGNGVSVNLAPLLADLEAENDDQQNTIDELTSIVSEQQALIEDLIIRMEIREECACDPTLGNGDNTLQPDKAYLLQNIPNPFNNTTSVGYFVPYTNAKAHIVISTMAGQIVHNMELSNLGVGAVSIDNSRMASAVYLYTLYIDGKRIDTKRMIVE